MQALVRRQKGAHGPRHSMRGEWKLGIRCNTLCNLLEEHSLQNAVVCEEILGSSYIQRCRSFSERVVLTR